jgi:transposase InsO family protein
MGGVLEHWIPEFTAASVQQWLTRVGVKTLFIESEAPGKTATPNRSMASCGTSAWTEKSSKPMLEAQLLVERWRRKYGKFRPHSTLGDLVRSGPHSSTRLMRN